MKIIKGNEIDKLIEGIENGDIIIDSRNISPMTKENHEAFRKLRQEQQGHSLEKLEKHNGLLDTLGEIDKIEHLVILENIKSDIDEELAKQKFKVGDKVKVLSYELSPESNSNKYIYQSYEGIVTKDNTKNNYISFSYSVKVNGIERIHFDTSEMLKI